MYKNMATTSQTVFKPFSIENFKEAFNNSKARQYLSDMELEQVRVALEEKDLGLLGTLYEVLLQEKAADEEIVRDFVMAKNRILDGFETEAVNTGKKMLEAPRKMRAAKTEKEEQLKAEGMLKNLNKK